VRTGEFDNIEINMSRRELHPLYPHEEEKEALLFIKNMQEKNIELISSSWWSVGINSQRTFEEEQFLR
jgi:hypothetical protein